MKYLIILIFLCHQLLAQDFTVSGLVKAANSEPVIGATVKLNRSKDSIFVKGTISNSFGIFQISKIEEGAYFLEVSAVSFKPIKAIQITVKGNNKLIKLPTIVLSYAKISLEEVVVTAKKPLVVHEVDRTVLNVESMPGSAGNSSYEILEKSPGVIVEIDGAISLNGKNNVLVLIDNRPTYLSGQDLVSYLKSLPGNTIEKIELIDNPPARYEAYGGAIINIVLKKNKLLGLTGNLNTSINQGVTTRHSEWYHLNYKAPKWNIYSNGGYNRGANFFNSIQERAIFGENEKILSQNRVSNKENFHNNVFWGRIGLDYYINSETIIGFVLHGQSIPFFSEMESEGSFNQSTLNTASIFNGAINTQYYWKNKNANLNFQKKFKKNKAELNAEINNVFYPSGGKQQFYSTGFGINSRFEYDRTTRQKIHNFKMDYSQNIQQNIKFEAGASGIANTHDNSIDHNDIVDNQLIDFSKSNHFIYNEKLFAVYGSFRKSGKIVSTQIGLRAENINLNGRLLPNASVIENTFTQNYTKIFPTAHVTFKLDSIGNSTLGLAYSYRINRPNYQLFNPFVRYLDPINFDTGNENLLPTFRQNFDFSYRYKQFINVLVGRSIGKNEIVIFTEIVGDKNYQKPYNLGQSQTWSLAINFTYNPIKVWQINYNFQRLFSEYSGSANQTVINNKVQTSRVRLLNQFTFSKSLSADITFNFNGREFSQLSIVEPRWFITNTGIQKKFLKEKATLRISGEDIFYKNKRRANAIGLKNATLVTKSEFDSRRVVFSLTYRFGNEKFLRSRNHQAQELGN